MEALIVRRRAHLLASLATLGLAWLALLPWLGAAQADDTLEYKIKAAYLYKFAPFVAWPDKVFASPDSPINVCVSGANPFGAALDRIAAGQRVGGRPVQVKHVASVAPDSLCQIVFLGGSAEQSPAQGAAALRGQPVLTVTDGAGGIIGFVLVDNRVRFSIDKAAADESHLAISSKLLSLAVEAH
ncbi:MAG TPA: YfiR family protein [Rhizomicrobium sp.]|nr:YfiR family protein [Rhizomicrobium sp.]